MRYLLDVNALLALALSDHEMHDRVRDWMKPRRAGPIFPVATCPLTELGFVRILSQPVYGYAVSECKNLLGELKTIANLDFLFFPDDCRAMDLPGWVTRSHQVTDGYLGALAARHGAKLATLDEKIPGAFLIPR